MFARFLACTGLCLVALGAAAAEGPLPSPTVDYSADRTMETDQGTFTGKVVFAKDKERTETQMQGMSMITIQRRDKQVRWMLMPAQKMYMESSIGEARGQMREGPAEGSTISEVGKETVEGFQTTKYKLLIKDGSAGGFMWFTPEGIAVKMDLLQQEGKKKSRTTITLKNLKIGPQDAALFEVPDGFNKMPNMGKFMPGLPGR
jgi:Domain of unknown function (DUF4412)